MKARSKIFLAAISSCIIIAIAGMVAYSCGPVINPDESRFALFRPGLATTEGLQPFFYTEHFVNSNAPYYETDYKKNCEEWRNYTNGDATPEDIYTIQYQTGREAFLKAYTSKNWAAFKSNSFVKWLEKSKHRDALHYMALAKYVEEDWESANYDPWAINHDSDSRAAMYDSLAQIAFQYCENKKTDAFLKERYAFQAVKLWYYADYGNAFQDKIRHCYDTYLKGKKTIVSAWALTYYIQVLPNGTERTKYLLEMFDRSDEKKVFAYKRISRKDLTEFDKVNTDTSLVPVIYALQAMMNPGKALTEIKDLYRYAPNSPYLPLLISREVNKLEDWLLSPDVLGFSSKLKENAYYRDAMNAEEEISFRQYAQENWAKDRDYLHEFRRYLQTLQGDGYAEKNFLRLSIAHLYHMEGSYAEAKSYLVEVYAPKEKTEWQIQLEIEKMISLIHLNDIRDKETKEQIYTGIQRLEQLGLQLKEYYDYTMEKEDDLAELLLLVSNSYKEKGDLVTAGLLYMKANTLTNEYDGHKGADSFSYRDIAYFDRYARPETIDSLLAFKAKPFKSSFEAYLVPAAWAKEECYLDLKGTILVREKKYEQAAEVFSRISEDFWQNNYEFARYLPENTILNAGTLLPVKSGPVNQYPYPSKKLIIEEIIKTQKAADATTDPEKKAELFFQLGNAQYNISYFGKAWMVFAYGNSRNEIYSYSEDSKMFDYAFYSFYPNSVKYGNSFYKLSDAMNMYYRAYNYAGNNRELAAKALLMLAYCDHIIHYNPYTQTKFYSKYLQQLRAEYTETKAYRESKVTCPDVKAFTNGG